MNILNLCGKIDQKSLAIYGAVKQVSLELDIPFVVVGASARDLVLYYGYGARIRRATEDIDFGFFIKGWDKYELLNKYLINAGFQNTKQKQRLLYDGKVVDLVPFGLIQDEEAKIAWPPDGDVVMNVMGFQEALEDTVDVIIQENPEIRIPVVMPPGLSLLKIICWTDRAANLKNRDAKDLLYLFKSYKEIPEIRETMFGHPEIMEEFDHEIEIGSAFILGVNAGAIASRQTREYLAQIGNNKLAKRPCNLLIEDMCEDIEEEFQKNRVLLNAYFRGINHKN